MAEQRKREKEREKERWNRGAGFPTGERERETERTISQVWEMSEDTRLQKDRQEGRGWPKEWKIESQGGRGGARLGASPIILQSSATTHRLFLPLPLSGGDVQIALMADQRGKLCPTGTYLFPKFVCLSVPTLPPPPSLPPSTPRCHLSLPTFFPCQPPNDRRRLSMGSSGIFVISQRYARLFTFGGDSNLHCFLFLTTQEVLPRLRGS